MSLVCPVSVFTQSQWMITNRRGFRLGAGGVQELRLGQQREELKQEFRLLGDPRRSPMGKRKAGWAPVPRKRPSRLKRDLTL